MKVKSEREVAESCLTLHNPMDCSLPGSSIHGILQARILEWGAIAFSRASPSLIEKKASTCYRSRTEESVTWRSGVTLVLEQRCSN